MKDESRPAPKSPLIRPPKRRGNRPLTKSTVPSLRLEQTMWADGAEVIVGIDEVGRGAWAGPLTVGAAVLPKTGRVNRVRDSKMLTEPEREALFDKVAAWCQAWAIGHVSHAECDSLGMAEAQRLAARRAIAGLGVTPDRVLIDGSWDFVGLGNTTRLIKGDAHCLSIATASILAKVSRDRVLRSWASSFPMYDFDKNKGYPCPRHQAALRAYGPSTVHRRSWAFVDALPFGLQRAEDDEETLGVGQSSDDQ